METCQDLCCMQYSCDVAVMMKHTCFLVSCRSMDLCKPRPAQLEHFSLVLSYRDRKAEEDEQVIELLKATKPPVTFVPKTSASRKTTIKTRKPHILSTARSPTVSSYGVTHSQKPFKPNLTPINTGNTSFIIPEQLKPNQNVLSWCLPSFIVPGVELRGGLKSGPYYTLGQVNNMDACMRKCCEIADCTTAYYDSNSCYAVRCLDKELCKVKISGPQQKVGYVIRNGWSLFQKNSEVLQQAAIAYDTSATSSSTTTTTSTTTIPPTTTTPLIPLTPLFPLHRNQTQAGNMFKLPKIGLPTKSSNEFGYCKARETLLDHRLIGGMKSGVFTEHGTVNNFNSCVKYCCLDRLCDLAYQVGLTCYSIKCYNSDSCRTFAVPRFFLNPIIAFVTRDPNETINASVSNVTIPTKKHPYNVMLNSQQKEIYTSNANTPLSSDESYVKIVPEKGEQDFTASSENISPNGEQYDLGNKRQHQSAKSRKDRSKDKTAKKNDKHLGPPAVQRAKYKKEKEENVRHNNKKLKKKMKKGKKTTDIANIFSRLLGEDASGSGEQAFDIASGSGLAEKLNLLESNLVQTLASKNLLAEEKKKKKKSNHRPKYKKKKHHSSAEKKNESIKPGERIQTGYINSSLSPQFGMNKHSAMEDVDIALIEALSPEFSDCDPVKYQCEHYCIALYHGGYRCICKEGYTLALDGKHCLYEGACDAHSHNCDQKCKYARDGFRCTCRSGFVMKKGINASCEDMDECAMGINGCSDVCINTQGSYICECSHGYTLGQDRMTCDAVGAVSKKSEIARPEEPKFSIPAMIISSPNDTVITQSHNMLLQCKSVGYPTPSVVWAYGNNHFQPLQADTRFTFLPDGLMLLQSAYVNDSGRYSCVTSNIAGTDIAHVNVRVNDIDECKTGNNNCQQVCQNTEGSYICDCYKGYALDDTQYNCQDVNECDSISKCQHYCWNTPGSYICGCENGFELQGDKRNCQDIDECENPFLSKCAQICNNTIGSYFCSCFRGYGISGDNKTCDRLPPNIEHEQPSTDYHVHSRKAPSFVFVGSCIVITIAVISGTLMYLIRNYKKRWKLEDDPNNVYAPPDGFLRNNYTNDLT